HTRSDRDWSSDVCSSDLALVGARQVGIPVLLDSHRPDAVELAPPHSRPDPLPGKERASRSLSPPGRGPGEGCGVARAALALRRLDRKSTRLNSSHDQISY